LVQKWIRPTRMAKVLRMAKGAPNESATADDAPVDSAQSFNC
jgi:hypothetical protein